MFLMIGSSIISIDAHCRCGGAAKGRGTSTDVAKEREGVERSQGVVHRHFDQ